MNKSKIVICTTSISNDNKSTKTYKLVQINPNAKNVSENKTEKSYAEVKSKKSNKTAHTINGNVNTVILQVNLSNSDWVTKQVELLNTINDNRANIT